MLDINYTLIVQIINFLILITILNFILYRPIREILRRRQEEFKSLEDSIHACKAGSDKKEKEIEEGRIDARKDGYAEKINFKMQGQDEEKHIINNAVSSAEKNIDAAISEIGIRSSEVRKILENEISGFSRELTEKILGRSI